MMFILNTSEGNLSKQSYGKVCCHHQYLPYVTTFGFPHLKTNQNMSVSVNGDMSLFGGIQTQNFHNDE